MAEVAGAVQAFDQYFTEATFKSQTYLWGPTETGLRASSGPCGIVHREQGQTDIFAGMTRVVLSIYGDLLNKSKYWALNSSWASIQLPSISNLNILGKTINPIIFNGAPVAVFQANAPTNIGLLTSNAVIDVNTGKVISGYVPLNQVLISQPIFQPSPTPGSLIDPITKSGLLYLTALGIIGQ